MEIKKNSTMLFDFKDKEIKILDNIELDLIQIVNDKKLDFELKIVLGKNSKLNVYQAVFDCISFKNNVYLKQNSKYELKSAFYANNVNMKIVNSSIHQEEKSCSNMEINGAVINRSKVICDGIVRIKKNAKLSEGYQKINGLLLDELSNISSEPVLEIENNEVRCSHGCSITQIKDEIAFYMQSRGISKSEIVNLIVEGYFNKLIENIEDNKINNKITSLI